jgi:hypothetical protein
VTPGWCQSRSPSAGISSGEPRDPPRPEKSKVIEITNGGHIQSVSWFSIFLAKCKNAISSFMAT